MTRDLVLQRISQAVTDAVRAGWAEREKLAAGALARVPEVLAMAAVANASALVSPDLDMLLDETAESSVRQACAPYERALMGPPGQPSETRSVEFVVPEFGSALMLVWMSGLLMGLDRIAGATGAIMNVDSMLGYVDSVDGLVDLLVTDVLRQAGLPAGGVS